MCFSKVATSDVSDVQHRVGLPVTSIKADAASFESLCMHVVLN